SFFLRPLLGAFRNPFHFEAGCKGKQIFSTCKHQGKTFFSFLQALLPVFQESPSFRSGLQR
ncbi:hypothetical protein, partial [Pontibacter lucknowensis]|uniref:hypothetical protein n=1 Tax=Pontibacter lucknowensis TaxID=1077936 RepID=UPI001F247D51